MLGAQLDGLEEADLAVAERGEHAVEDDDVVVGVDVEGGAGPRFARCLWKKLTAPSSASEGAPGLALRSVERMARRKIRSTAPATRVSCCS